MKKVFQYCKSKLFRGNRITDAVILLVIFILVSLAVGGWIANIVKLAQMDINGNIIKIILRCLGIPFVFLGIIMGYL